MGLIYLDEDLYLYTLRLTIRRVVDADQHIHCTTFRFNQLTESLSLELFSTHLWVCGSFAPRNSPISRGKCQKKQNAGRSALASTLKFPFLPGQVRSSALSRGTGRSVRWFGPDAVTDGAVLLRRLAQDVRRKELGLEEQRIKAGR